MATTRKQYENITLGSYVVELLGVHRTSLKLKYNT